MALHRRHLILAGITSTTALAGCFENTGENEEPEPESEPEPEPEPVPDPEPSTHRRTEPPIHAEVDGVKVTWFGNTVSRAGPDAEKWWNFDIVVVNDSTVTHEYIAVKVRGLDEEGEEVASFEKEKSDFEADEIWDFEVDVTEKGWPMTYNEDEDRWDLGGIVDGDIEIQTEPF